MSSSYRKDKFSSLIGFSLVELLIVIGIIAILGMIGFPGYQAYMQRAKRTEAKDSLMRLATNQERYYLSNATYATDAALLGFPGGFTENGRYEITIEADAIGFVATATASGEMLADSECHRFFLRETGERTATPDPFDRCW